MHATPILAPPLLAWALTLLLVPSALVAQTTNLTLLPEADAFLREAAPGSNFGRAGSLSVAGVAATNGLGMLGGRADSLARFRLAIASLDEAFGQQQWVIWHAALRLYEQGMPNNASFTRGVGAFEVRWLASGDEWEEGTGSPNAPTTDGVAFQDLASLLDEARDLSLGIFTNAGLDGPLTVDLPMPDGFVQDLRSGGPVTLHFAPASDSIGFTFLSRSDPRTDLRVMLSLTVGSAPRILSIEQTNASELLIRFNTRSNWAHHLESRVELRTNGLDSWSNLFSAPAQPFDSQVGVLDGVTNAQRFYRLRLSPP